MSMMLEALLGTARKEGWAAGRGSIAEIRHGALSLGLTEVPVRRGGPSVMTLRPLDRREAPVNSLSARYGKGAQPLHTDGAHMPVPPDVVVLACAATSSTPTRLWRLGSGSDYSFTARNHLEHGVFLVAGGTDSFFSVAYSEQRLRYDPGCMIPCDSRARETARYFETALESAIDHHWDEPGTVLVIDNRRALHARASVIDDPNREIERVNFLLPEGMR